MTTQVRDSFGRNAEAFMIGGMPEPDWFKDLVMRGDADISTEADLRGRKLLPLVDRNGDTAVILFETDHQKLSEGSTGDWVVRYRDKDVLIIKKNVFRQKFVITKRDRY